MDSSIHLHACTLLCVCASSSPAAAAAASHAELVVAWPVTGTPGRISPLQACRHSAWLVLPRAPAAARWHAILAASPAPTHQRDASASCCSWSCRQCNVRALIALHGRPCTTASQQQRSGASLRCCPRCYGQASPLASCHADWGVGAARANMLQGMECCSLPCSALILRVPRRHVAAARTAVAADCHRCCCSRSRSAAWSPLSGSAPQETCARSPS